VTVLLQVRNLAKRYGDVQALQELSVDVGEGGCLVLLGRNGAGKTTALRCMAGVLLPSAGTVHVEGVDAAEDPAGVRSRVGLMPEVPGLYERMSVRDYLDYFGAVYEVEERERSRRIGELLEVFELTDAGDRWLGTFSKGMRQKVALIRATLHRPRLVLADEPTSALDPDSARRAWAYLKDLQSRGCALVICTHSMEEAEHLAGSIGIMSSGRALAVGTISELRRASGLKTRQEIRELPTLQDVYLAIVGNRIGEQRELERLEPSKAALVARRDLRDAVSELRLTLAMIALTLAIPIASASGVRALAAFGGGTAVVNRLSLVGAFFVVFIPASFSLVLALESFVGERERTTLEVLLSTPLREAEIYAGKVASVLIVSLTLCYGGLGVYCLVTFPGLGYLPLGILLALALSTVCQVAAMVAGAVIISLNARTMRAANVMASFIILPMSVVLQAEAALILVGRGELMWAFAMLMALAAVILLRMGYGGFSREALLARDTGLGRPLRRAMGALRASFARRPSLPRLLWRRRIPLAVATAGLPAGALTGYLAGTTSAIPSGIVRPVLTSLAGSTAGSDAVVEALAIFAHNLLAFVLVAVFAVVSVGLSGFLLTFLPGFLLGFAAAASSWAVALAGIVPNGLVEVPAAIIAGGLAIQVGAAAIHMDGRGSWTGRVLAALADYILALRWLVPALAVSAALEVMFG
jgi:ABC-2 type transport system ATP-binding protein